MSYRAFWQRRCRAAAAGAVLKPCLLYTSETQIIAASVRNPMHVTDCALAGADTVSYTHLIFSGAKYNASISIIQPQNHCQSKNSDSDCALFNLLFD